MSEPIAPIGHQTMSFFFQPISEIQYLGADTKCRATYQKTIFVLGFHYFVFKVK